jgi:hypothetical protein
MTVDRVQLHQARLVVLATWIGYAAASLFLFLWPASAGPPGLLAIGAYIVVFAIATLLSIWLIGHRRPWARGPRREPYRLPRLFAFVSGFVLLFLLGMLADLLNLDLPTDLAFRMGVGLLWVTATVTWRPLMRRTYPSLWVGSGKA